jgi:hypothetical protein
MADYARDPNALSVLMKLDSPTNRTVGGPNASYVPNISRNNARVGLLRNFFGLGPDEGDISQADLESIYQQEQESQQQNVAMAAQARVLPEHVKGQYGLQGEAMKLAAAKEAAHEKDLEFQQHREEQQRWQAGQNELGRNAIAGRQQTGIAATTASHTGTAQDVLARQQIADLDRQLAGLRAPGNKQVQAPRPAGEGFFGRLIGPNQDTLNRDLITQLEAKKAALVGGGSAAGGQHPAIGPWVEEVRSRGLTALQLQQEAPSMPPEIVAQIMALAGVR